MNRPFNVVFCSSFHKKGSLNPYLYETAMLLLPSTGELEKLGSEPGAGEVDLLQGMWSLGASL